MSIFFDLYHLPQYNFFRNTIQSLGPEKVELGCVDRGKLVKIIRHECPDHQLYVFGDYKYNRGPISMATRIILPRVYHLIQLFRKKRYDIVGTAHYQANAAAKLTGIPNFSILDDPRAGVVQIVKSSTREFYLPPFVEGYHEVKKFNALKEWSYLSPTYFQPDESVLSEYALEKKRYIFIREVSTETSNYLLQESNLVLKLSSALKGQRVILSLENKAMADQYPSDWTILEEPVLDIHSLMYYANLVISSGDSMAREGGMLGVPSIYLGNRDMPANNILMDRGILFRRSASDLPEFIQDLETGSINVPDQDPFRCKLLEAWVDVNQFINSIIIRLKQD
jgi:predicted glycosyltransferase